MKNKLLKSLLIVAVIALVGACSSEDTVVNNTEYTNGVKPVTAARGSFWGDKLGVINADGTATLTVDEALVKSDFEQILRAEGEGSAVQSVWIERKVNANDPSDFTYALIGSALSGTSVGVLLSGSAKGENLYLENPNPNPGSPTDGATSVSCRGCAYGCHLSYVKIQGHKVFYCDEDGCGDFCTKTETSMD